MVIPKAPVNIDDPENINRFLEQMKQKKYGSAFTPSMLSNISAASAASGDAVEPASPFNQQSSHPGPQHAMMKGNGVSEATASSDKSSLEDDKPHRQVAMLLPHESGSFAKKPVVNQSEADPSIAVSLTLYRSRGVSLSADSDDALARAELQHWMEENCPPSHRLARRTATPQPLLDKIVQSPLLSGLQAPPPTPETGPVSQRDVTNIIHSTFDGLHGSHPPVLTLGDSKYAPRRKTTLGQTISGQQNPHEGEVYTPFDTPNRELSSASRLKRDEDVERMKSQPSPKQGNFATSASTVVGGDEKDSKESPPNNTGSPTHMAASKSLTAHRSDSSLQQNSGQQISEFQVARMGQQSTSTVKLSSPPLSLHSSANLDLTGDDWIPPHLRPPTDEPLVAKSQDGEVARSLVKSPGEAGSPQPLKREEISFMVNVTTKSETNLHNNQTSCSLHSRLHSKKPAPIFTGDIHDPTPAHRAPGSSSIKPDEDNPWQSGQPTSGILTSPFTPTEQVIYTPAGSSTDSQTPPQLRPREGFTDVTPHLSHDKPDVVSALLGKPLKHVEPLISNPFTLTAVTADHGITPEASKVSATVAAVDRSLSAVADVFKPSFMASTKSPMPIQPPHPLSAQGNSFPAFSEPNNAPRSVLESGVITPSSMTFIAVSPATAAAAGITAAMLGPNEGHNPEDIMFFKSWPKSDDERRPAARIRKVFITNLPLSSTANFVQSLVFGGPIEHIGVASTSAAVVFVHADDMEKYYNATANRVVYKKEGDKEHFVRVELAKDIDVVGGLLREMIGRSMTRCVKAIGVDEDWGMLALWKMAERKGRKVENIVDEVNAGGFRTVTFRFCNMLDAKAFIAVLQRDEEWEHCHMLFAPDPCAQATGVHFD